MCESVIEKSKWCMWKCMRVFVCNVFVYAQAYASQFSDVCKNCASCSTGCTEKNVRFPHTLGNKYDPTLAYKYRRKRFSNLSMQSQCPVTPILAEKPIAAQCWRGRMGRILNILGEKTEFFLNILYVNVSRRRSRRCRRRRRRRMV